MCRGLIVFFTVAVVMVGATAAFAVTGAATQSVTVTIEEVALLGASADPGTFTLSGADTVAGSLPVVSDTSTSLSWTSNAAAGLSRKITARLDSDMPASFVLKATLAKPSGSGGTPAPQRTLSSTAGDMFWDITNESCTGATITFEASLSAMVPPQTVNRTVTWTLSEDQ